MCIILGCIHWTLYICYLLIFVGSFWIQHLLYSISFELSLCLYLWIHIFGIVLHIVFCISVLFQTWYFYLSILLDQLILVAFLIWYIWLPPFFFYVTHLILKWVHLETHIIYHANYIIVNTFTQKIKKCWHFYPIGVLLWCEVNFYARKKYRWSNYRS